MTEKTFENIYEIRQSRRYLDGCELSIDQINLNHSKALEIKKSENVSFPKAIYLARMDFKKNHEPTKDGQWRSK